MSAERTDSSSQFESPVDAFHVAVAAVERGDWHGVVRACDPASLGAFRRRLIEQFDRTEPRTELTVDDYLRHSPEMPREVAEYQVAQHRAMADPQRRLREELPDVEDVAHLKRLGQEEAFTRWLEGRSPRRQVVRMLAERRIGPAAGALTLDQLTPSFAYESVGFIGDGERVAHVLYRCGEVQVEDADGAAAEWIARLPPDEQELVRDLENRQYPMVATCRRQADGTWRLIADYGFLRLGSIGICITDETAEDPADDTH